MIDAYLTAVEEGEEQLLSTMTAKAVAAAAEPVEPPTGGEPRLPAESRRWTSCPGKPVRCTPPAADEVQDMLRAAEGRWGSREVEIAHVELLDREGQPSFVFHSGDPMSVRLRVERCMRRSTTCLRHQLLQRRRSVLLRHQYVSRRNDAGAACRRGRVTFDVEALDSSKELTSSMWPCTSATAIHTTTTGCFIPFA